MKVLFRNKWLRMIRLESGMIEIQVRNWLFGCWKTIVFHQKTFKPDINGFVTQFVHINLAKDAYKICLNSGKRICVENTKS